MEHIEKMKNEGSRKRRNVDVGESSLKQPKLSEVIKKTKNLTKKAFEELLFNAVIDANLRNASHCLKNRIKAQTQRI